MDDCRQKAEEMAHGRSGIHEMDWRYFRVALDMINDERYCQVATTGNHTAHHQTQNVRWLEHVLQSVPVMNAALYLELAAHFDVVVAFGVPLNVQRAQQSIGSSSQQLAPHKTHTNIHDRGDKVVAQLFASSESKHTVYLIEGVKAPFSFLLKNHS